jgi:glycosyltransferase involved in cell wall biosynthesis
VDLADRRKGGAALKGVLAAMRGKAHFLAFGRAAAELGEVQSTGFLRDFRRMPLIYSAGDVFLGTSIEEAFGQTFCEAAACGVPSVGFRVGGIPEIARPGVNARLVEAGDVEGLISELDSLLSDASARAEMGRAGRALVEAEFTLRRQGERWMDFLSRLPAA